MFGKNASEYDQVSEDEDWGPTTRKRKARETNAASTLMTLGETDNKISIETLPDVKEEQLSKKSKRPIFRLPHDAVEVTLLFIFVYFDSVHQVCSLSVFICFRSFDLFLLRMNFQKEL